MEILLFFYQSAIDRLVVAKIKNENGQNKPKETVISAKENEILTKNPAFLVQEVEKGGVNSPPPFCVCWKSQAPHRSGWRLLDGSNVALHQQTEPPLITALRRSWTIIEPGGI